jgi:hypothetical protein
LITRGRSLERNIYMHIVKELQEYRLKEAEYEAPEFSDSLLDDWERSKHLSLSSSVLLDPYILRNKYYDCI